MTSYRAASALVLVLLAVSDAARSRADWLAVLVLTASVPKVLLALVLAAVMRALPVPAR